MPESLAYTLKIKFHQATLATSLFTQLCRGATAGVIVTKMPSGMPRRS